MESSRFSSGTSRSTTQSLQVLFSNSNPAVDQRNGQISAQPVQCSSPVQSSFHSVQSHVQNSSLEPLTRKKRPAPKPPGPVPLQSSAAGPDNRDKADQVRHPAARRLSGPARVDLAIYVDSSMPRPSENTSRNEAAAPTKHLIRAQSVTEVQSSFPVAGSYCGIIPPDIVKCKRRAPVAPNFGGPSVASQLKNQPTLGSVAEEIKQISEETETDKLNGFLQNAERFQQILTETLTTDRQGASGRDVLSAGSEADLLDACSSTVVDFDELTFDESEITFVNPEPIQIMEYNVKHGNHSNIPKEVTEKTTTQTQLKDCHIGGQEPHSISGQTESDKQIEKRQSDLPETGQVNQLLSNGLENFRSKYGEEAGMTINKSSLNNPGQEIGLEIEAKSSTNKTKEGQNVIGPFKVKLEVQSIDTATKTHEPRRASNSVEIQMADASITAEQAKFRIKVSPVEVQTTDMLTDVKNLRQFLMNSKEPANYDNSVKNVRHSGEGVSQIQDEHLSEICLPTTKISSTEVQTEMPASLQEDLKSAETTLEVTGFPNQSSCRVDTCNSGITTINQQDESHSEENETSKGLNNKDQHVNLKGTLKNQPSAATNCERLVEVQTEPVVASFKSVQQEMEGNVDKQFKLKENSDDFQSESVSFQIPKVHMVEGSSSLYKLLHKTGEKSKIQRDENYNSVIKIQPQGEERKKQLDQEDHISFSDFTRQHTKREDTLTGKCAIGTTELQLLTVLDKTDKKGSEKCVTKKKQTPPPVPVKTAKFGPKSKVTIPGQICRSENINRSVSEFTTSEMNKTEMEVNSTNIYQYLLKSLSLTSSKGVSCIPNSAPSREPKISGNLQSSCKTDQFPTLTNFFDQNQTNYNQKNKGLTENDQNKDQSKKDQTNDQINNDHTEEVHIWKDQNKDQSNKHNTNEVQDENDHINKNQPYQDQTENGQRAFEVCASVLVNQEEVKLYNSSSNSSLLERSHQPVQPTPSPPPLLSTAPPDMVISSPEFGNPVVELEDEKEIVKTEDSMDVKQSQNQFLISNTIPEISLNFMNSPREEDNVSSLPPPLPSTAPPDMVIPSSEYGNPVVEQKYGNEIGKDEGSLDVKQSQNQFLVSNTSQDISLNFMNSPSEEDKEKIIHVDQKASNPLDIFLTPENSSNPLSRKYSSNLSLSNVKENQRQVNSEIRTMNQAPTKTMQLFLSRDAYDVAVSTLDKNGETSEKVGHEFPGILQASSENSSDIFKSMIKNEETKEERDLPVKDEKQKNDASVTQLTSNPPQNLNKIYANGVETSLDSNKDMFENCQPSIESNTFLSTTITLTSNIGHKKKNGDSEYDVKSGGSIQFQSQQSNSVQETASTEAEKQTHEERVSSIYHLIKKSLSSSPSKVSSGTDRQSSVGEELIAMKRYGTSLDETMPSRQQLSWSPETSLESKSQTHKEQNKKAILSSEPEMFNIMSNQKPMIETRAPLIEKKHMSNNISPKPYFKVSFQRMSKEIDSTQEQKISDNNCQKSTDSEFLPLPDNASSKCSGSTYEEKPITVLNVDEKSAVMSLFQPEKEFSSSFSHSSTDLWKDASDKHIISLQEVGKGNSDIIQSPEQCPMTFSSEVNLSSTSEDMDKLEEKEKFPVVPQFSSKISVNPSSDHSSSDWNIQHEARVKNDNEEIKNQLLVEGSNAGTIFSNNRTKLSKEEKEYSSDELKKTLQSSSHRMLNKIGNENIERTVTCITDNDQKNRYSETVGAYKDRSIDQTFEQVSDVLNNTTEKFSFYFSFPNTSSDKKVSQKMKANELKSTETAHIVRGRPDSEVADNDNYHYPRRSLTSIKQALAKSSSKSGSVSKLENRDVSRGTTDSAVANNDDNHYPRRSLTSINQAFEQSSLKGSSVSNLENRGMNRGNTDSTDTDYDDNNYPRRSLASIKQVFEESSSKSGSGSNWESRDMTIDSTDTDNDDNHYPRTFSGSRKQTMAEFIWENIDTQETTGSQVEKIPHRLNMNMVKQHSKTDDITSDKQHISHAVKYQADNSAHQEKSLSFPKSRRTSSNEKDNTLSHSALLKTLSTHSEDDSVSLQKREMGEFKLNASHRLTNRESNEAMADGKEVYQGYSSISEQEVKPVKVRIQSDKDVLWSSDGTVIFPKQHLQNKVPQTKVIHNDTGKSTTHSKGVEVHITGNYLIRSLHELPWTPEPRLHQNKPASRLPKEK